MSDTPKKTQREKFIEAAQAAGCDNSDVKFSEALRTIGRHIEKKPKQTGDKNPKAKGAKSRGE